ncbi:hypothetical protein [Phyllobacterium salinisoli]|uniref:hypothetical protein n=1 Tax=Phyllobacterium salinisoli TaxID=1899321 RepID=UPI0011C0650B|nr:hypothetical protein [Phyllobacterium salinisoli]
MADAGEKQENEDQDDHCASGDQDVIFLYRRSLARALATTGAANSSHAGNFNAVMAARASISA